MYTSCVGNIAQNIMRDCDNPQVGGYTGRGLLIPLTLNPTIVQDTGNKRIIKNITVGTDDNIVFIDNIWNDAYIGSSTQSNADNGRTQYTKTVSFRVPQRGGATSKDLIEPLVDSPLGFMVILEKKFRGGDGSFEVIGFEQALRVNSDGVSRNEYENGGDISVTASCSENYFEYALFDEDYSSTLGMFETLITKTF